MELNPDFKDLWSCLNAAQAKYLLVGGYAVGFHAAPRFTKDLDVWVEPTEENARRVMIALREFGAPLGALTESDLATPGIVFQMGVKPNRIDVLTAIDGVEFGPAWAERGQTSYGGEVVHVLSRTHLIANKRASGRPQDLLDVRALEADTDDD